MIEPSSSAPPLDAVGAPPRPEFDRRRAWLIAAMIVTFMLINYADKSVLGLAAVPIMDELGISNSAYGMISSSFSLLFSLSGLIVGFASARITSRVLLFTMAALWAVAQLPVLVVASVPTLVAGRVLLGAAEGPAASMSLHALYKWFPADRRGFPSALQIGGASLGILVAAPVVTWLITAFGWRSAVVVLAVTSAVWSLVWWRVGHDGPYGRERTPRTADTSAGTPPAAAGQERLPYRRLLLDGTVLGSVTAAFGASWALALSHAWLPVYLRTRLGMTPGEAATLISAVSAFSLVLLLSVPPLMDRLRRRGFSSRWSTGAPQGVAVAVAGLAMAVFPFVDGRGVQLVLIALAFGGHAIVFPLYYMTASAVVPPIQRGGGVRHRRRHRHTARADSPVPDRAPTGLGRLTERRLHPRLPADRRRHAGLRPGGPGRHPAGAGRAPTGPGRLGLVQTGPGPRPAAARVGVSPSSARRRN
ncbi:MFS transporter [Streptomyces sp. NPDC000151]|uniref:MFS transporter n=1 Tax=Streptomyces sp. NPDC000151 TaxID=3154244 RepID=UPI00332E62AC